MKNVMPAKVGIFFWIPCRAHGVTQEDDICAILHFGPGNSGEPEGSTILECLTGPLQA